VQNMCALVTPALIAPLLFAPTLLLSQGIHVAVAGIPKVSACRQVDSLSKEVWRLPQIGVHMKEVVAAYFWERGEEATVKYINPS